jgi:hypothetical protein
MGGLFTALCGWVCVTGREREKGNNKVKRNIKRVTTYPWGFFDFATSCDRFAGGQNDEPIMGWAE